MKNFTKLLLLFGIVIFYIISINIFANIISTNQERYEISQSRIGGSIVEINLGESVSVQVTRAPKFYGQFHENNGMKYLNLFYVCNIPCKIKNYNFIYFHIIFLIIITLLTILMLTKKIQKEVKNEKCVEDSSNLGNLVTGNDA